MTEQNERDIIHPITIILDGLTSYHAWSQNMTIIIKGSQTMEVCNWFDSQARTHT